MNKDINKKDIVDQINLNSELPKKEIASIVTDVFNIVSSEISKGNKISIRGLGSFFVKLGKKKQLTNVHTKEKIEIPPQARIRFKAGKKLKKTVAYLTPHLKRNSEQKKD